MPNLLEIESLNISYGSTPILKDFNFNIARGEIVSILGEIGSGKTSLAKAIVKLDSKLNISANNLNFNSVDLRNLNDDKIRSLRGSEIAYIPENSQTSLNPVVKISTQLIECLREKQGLSKVEARLRAEKIFNSVGIPSERIDDYPNSFSGGMKQRAVIAIALCQEPSLILADEPTSALDVRVQMEILNLLKTLSKKNNSSVILFTSDLFVATYMGGRIAVLHDGRIIEEGSAEDILKNPKHPYTKKYIEATSLLKNT